MPTSRPEFQNESPTYDSFDQIPSEKAEVKFQDNEQREPKGSHHLSQSPVPHESVPQTKTKKSSNNLSSKRQIPILYKVAYIDCHPNFQGRNPGRNANRGFKSSCSHSTQNS